MVAACGHRTDALSPREIVERMNATYASARTYRDQGVAFVDEPFRWSLFKAFFGLRSLDRFSTDFDRTRGSLVFAYDAMRVAGRLSEVPEQLNAIRPISKGSSSFAPMLLLGDRADLPNAVREHDDGIHGVDCFVIRATNQRGIEDTLWIEKRRFLIRRVRQKIRSRSASFTQTLDYQSVTTQ
jgi:hypothetical protein